MIGQVTISDSAAIALAFATIVLAFITYLNVRVTRKLAAAETNPFVYIDMMWSSEVTSVSRQNFLRIFITNIGKAHARDIHITPQHANFPIMSTYGDDASPQYFSNVPTIVNGIRGLAPDQELLLPRVLSSAVEELAPVNVDVAYKTAAGKTITEAFTLDFPSFYSSFRLSGQR